MVKEEIKFLHTPTHYRLASIIIDGNGHLTDLPKISEYLNIQLKVLEAVVFKWYSLDGGATTTKNRDQYHFSDKFISKLIDELRGI